MSLAQGLVEGVSVNSPSRSLFGSTETACEY